MQHRIFRTAALVFAGLAVAAAAYAAQDDLKEISDSGITVSYPPGMESQAKRVLGIARKSIVPSLGVQRQIAALLTDVDAVAQSIAELLGAQEKQDETAARLRTYKNKSIILAQCFSNIRLSRKSDAIATNGVDAGALQVRYVQETDEFKMALDLSDMDENKLKRSYFPVFVNTDGSIRAEDKLGEMTLEFLGSGKGLVIAPIHETVSYIIAEQLQLYHPFARWFNEGVSGWVTRHVVVKYDPKLTSLAQEILYVNDRTRALRNKVNFVAWPQRAFQNRTGTYYDPLLEAAQTQYAIEAITGALGRNGPQYLPKIMSELNYNSNADSDKICEAITKVTGEDFKRTLMEYVPPDIRAGIESGEAEKLTSQVRGLVAEKRWTEAAEKLRRALEMTPQDVNARLNLAWIEREIGERRDSEIQVFLVSRLLEKGDYSFSLYAGSIEGNYVLGRLAVLMGNIEYAKKFLEPVLAYKPDHEDAKRAMESIKELEAAAAGPPRPQGQE